MKLRIGLIVGAYLALAACATAPEPQIVTKLVDVPVAVKCVPDPAPAKPDFVDADGAIHAAPDIRTLSKLYAVGRLQHYAYEGELEAALKGCTG